MQQNKRGRRRRGKKKGRDIIETVEMIGGLVKMERMRKLGIEWIY